MKLLEYKQFNNSNDEKKLNKKKVVIVAVIAIAVLIAGIINIAYLNNTGFRNFMDIYILFKGVNEDDLPSINIDSDKDFYVCAFNNYVAVLENHKLTLYNTSAKEAASFNVNVSTPIFATHDNYLVVAEKGQQKLYLIKDKKMLWEKDLEGQISRVNINNNGYVSVIVSGTTYKSVITMYSNEGNEIFKTFLSSTIVIDSDVSGDNKYLSFCEVDLSGTTVKNIVKTISVEKAKSDPQNAIINKYEIPTNTLVTNLEYHEKNQLVCMGSNKIYLLKDGKIEELDGIDDEDVEFAGAQLEKSYFKLLEEKAGINNQTSKLEIINTSSKNRCTYVINGIAKDVYTTPGVIAVNLGSEAYFVDENGWLIKKFTSSQEIRNIVISNKIAGIVYGDKIKILGL